MIQKKIPQHENSQYLSNACKFLHPISLICIGQNCAYKSVALFIGYFTFSKMAHLNN